MFKKLKEKFGYISIETVIIFGVMLIFAMALINKFFFVGKELAGNGLGNVDQAFFDFLQYDTEAPIDIIVTD